MTKNKARKTPPTTTRSIRCSPEAWRKAQIRADKEGVTLTHVLREFVEGYANGELNLPKVVKVYNSPSK